MTVRPVYVYAKGPPVVPQEVVEDRRFCHGVGDRGSLSGQVVAVEVRIKNRVAAVLEPRAGDARDVVEGVGDVGAAG